MRTRGSLLVIWTVVGLIACGGPRRDVPSSKASGLSGVVLDHQNQPSPWPVVLVTKASDGAFVAAGVGTVKGTFEVDVPAGEYTLTIASPDGFARLASFTAPAEDASVRLSEECSRLAGRVTGEVRTGDIVWLRATKEPYSYLGARVGDGGAFESCVPAGGYFFETDDDGLVALRTYVEVPRDRAIDVVAYRSATVEQQPSEYEAIAAGLVQSISSKVRAVGLGESNHGTKEFLSTRERLTRELAERADVRFVMLEAGAGEVIALNEYIQGAAVDPRKAVAKLGYWMWDTEEFLDVLESLRKYNASLVPKKRIQLLGLDVQNTEGAVDALVAAAERLKLDSADLARLAVIRSDDGSGALSLAPEDLETLQRLLDRLGNPAGAGTDMLSLQYLLAARSLRHRLAMLQANEPSVAAQLRDQGMADLVLTLLETVPGSKACLWVHNVHIGKTQWNALDPMGQHLQAALEDGYYAVGLFSYSGEARAWDENSSVAVIAHELKPALAHSLEGVVVARSEDQVVEVPFDEAPPQLREWLRLPRYTREFGAVYPMAAYEWDLRQLDQAFDAAVVIRRTTATTPTDTGVRTKAAAPAAP